MEGIAYLISSQFPFYKRKNCPHLAHGSTIDMFVFHL